MATGRNEADVRGSYGLTMLRRAQLTQDHRGHLVARRRHDVAGGVRRGSAEVRRHVARAAVRSAGVLLALVLLAAPRPASAAGRVALVVGNSTYEHIGRLPNPANDAADLSAALRRLGFDVTVAQDAGRTALTEALRAFTRRSAGADVALVFYAGHGMEMDGVNYLLPVDARLERDTDVRYETVTLDDVLASTSGAGLRLVILDACRNNPLARSMTRTVRTRNVSNGAFGDLDDALLGDETLVAYSAEAGTVADDGAGRNSPYATALLAHLEERLEVGMLFRRVRERVLNATDGRQRPHEYHSLLGEHYLGGAPGSGGLAAAGGTAGPAASVAVSGSSPALAQQETVFWESVRESANPAELEAYLARWPNGVYAPLARMRVAALRPAAAVDPLVVADTRRQDLDVFRDCPDCPEMVVVPAGTFRMGSPASEAGRYDDVGPRHEVTLRSPFALGRYEVTRREYAAFVSATGWSSRGCYQWEGRWKLDDDASWRAPGFAQGEGHPVVCVNWTDAQAYVRWLREETGKGYRLPSEAEWEYAARGGTTTSRYWGNMSSAQCAYGNGADAAAKRVHPGWTVASCDDGAVHTASVGSYEANAFGLFDMLGNVWEWTEDCWHGTYAGAPGDGSAWTRGGDCGRRVLRGGSWRSHPPYVRSASRNRYTTGDRLGAAGFRVSRTLDQPDTAGIGGAR